MTFLEIFVIGCYKEKGGNSKAETASITEGDRGAKGMNYLLL